MQARPVCVQEATMAQANVQAAAEEAGVRVCLSWVSPQPQSTQQHGAGAMAREDPRGLSMKILPPPFWDPWNFWGVQRDRGSLRVEGVGIWDYLNPKGM